MSSKKYRAALELSGLSRMFKNSTPFGNQCGAEPQPVNGLNFHVRLPALPGEMVDQIGWEIRLVESEVDCFAERTFKIGNSDGLFHKNKMT